MANVHKKLVYIIFNNLDHLPQKETNFPAYFPKASYGQSSKMLYHYILVVLG